MQAVTSFRKDSNRGGQQRRRELVFPKGTPVHSTRISYFELLLLHSNFKIRDKLIHIQKLNDLWITTLNQTTSYSFNTKMQGQNSSSLHHLISGGPPSSSNHQNSTSLMMSNHHHQVLLGAGIHGTNNSFISPMRAGSKMAAAVPSHHLNSHQNIPTHSSSNYNGNVLLGGMQPSSNHLRPHLSSQLLHREISNSPYQLNKNTKKNQDVRVLSHPILDSQKRTIIVNGEEDGGGGGGGLHSSIAVGERNHLNLGSGSTIGNPTNRLLAYNLIT